MAEETQLETLGTQKVTAVGIIMTVAAALLTGVCTWYEFGPAFGILIIVAGIYSGFGWAARRGQPCFVIEHECLVHQFGKQDNRYEWAVMRRPVRLTHKLFQNFLEVRRAEGLPWLIPVDDLNERERKRLLAIVTEIVCSRKRDETPLTEAPEVDSLPATTTSG